MTDYLEQKYREITARITELAPLVDEYNRLTAAAQALAALGPAQKGTTPSKPSKPSTRARSRQASAKRPHPAKAKPPAPTSGQKSARTASGGRAGQALSLVQGQPGITIAELAKAMGIQKSYLYRILPSLQKERRVMRQGDGWHPKGS